MKYENIRPQIKNNKEFVKEVIELCWNRNNSK